MFQTLSARLLATTTLRGSRTRISFAWKRLIIQNSSPFTASLTTTTTRCNSTVASILNDSDSEDEEDIQQHQHQQQQQPQQQNQRITPRQNVQPLSPSQNQQTLVNDDNNIATTEGIDDLVFSRQKAGTPSPWAVFDAWGAGNEINANSELLNDRLTDDEQNKLSAQSVRIPMAEDERHALPAETDILHAYDKFLQQRSTVHLGYPYNLMYDHQELFRFMKYSINNLGDPFVAGNYGVHSRQFECAVVDFFARLWKMDPNSHWGYITTSGTEGNLHGILLARECHPDGILYTSQETHYSVFKAARYYRMDLRSIPTLPMGEINYELLAQELDRNREYPAIINVNIGTTVKGAIDNLDRILDILTALDIPRERYHIHCDGALFALMMPFIDNAPEISFQKPIDSIAVSGHKMLGCPMPCGVALCRKEHVQKVEQHIGYLNTVDTTIMGSRNGQAALYMWYSLRKKGIPGIKRDVRYVLVMVTPVMQIRLVLFIAANLSQSSLTPFNRHCIETAKYLLTQLSRVGFSSRLNDLSSTVVLERPVEDAFIRRWQLACEEDIAHVVVMPNVTTGKIDLFVKEFIDSATKFGRIRPIHPQSQLAKLQQQDSWQIDDAAAAVVAASR
jgi:histidine decarboxylase